MSLLEQQLSAIAQNTQTVALDRKKRSKLHSVSFIYNPQEAATQDYETIYYEALEALSRLEQIDKRFGKFKLSIFSETSINIDRQVQSQEQNENLDKTINAFLSLVAPYWHLAIALRSTEWLLRRFQINYHNTEHLLLTTLPYYKDPVFERILYVVPKMPVLFQWLAGFKKANNKSPSRNSLVKAFTDVDFFNLYSKFIGGELGRGNQYRLELVFFVSMAISALAALSSENSEKLLDYVPNVLSVCGLLLVSKDQETKISGYTIMAVLVSAVPLSRDVIIASIETILAHAGFDGNRTQTQAFTSILKLYRSIQTDPLTPLAPAMFELVPEFLNSDSSYSELISKTKDVNFACSYIRTLIKTDKLDSKSAVASCEFEFSHKHAKVILGDILAQLSSTNSANYVPILKHFQKTHSDWFNESIESSQVSLEQLEMSLQTTFTEVEITEDVHIVPEESAELDESLENVHGSYASYLDSSSEVASEFQLLQKQFMNSVVASNTIKFLSSCFKDQGAQISFLIRLSLVQNIPLKVRTFALKLVATTIESLPETYSVHILVPILSVLLIDSNKLLRTNTLAIFKKMEARSPGKESILGSLLYGKATKDIAMISPKIGHTLISSITERTSELSIDGEQFHKLFESLVSEKKTGTMILAFYASNANITEHPATKLGLLQVVTRAARVTKGALPPSKIFENLLTSFVEKRESWRSTCIVSGIDFGTFETQVMDIVSKKEPNEAAIKFLDSALNCSSQSLSEIAAAKLTEIFSSLSSEYQLRLVKSIVEVGLSEDDTTICYDTVELLESLDLSNDIFVQFLKESSLNSSSDQQSNVPKRRRRSSASTRQAMKEQEVSFMASAHLKKVTLILDVLEKESRADFDASFDLLKLLFDTLDDLETLGTDGKLPVLYSQETLASCMTNVIKALEESKLKPKEFASIRADVVVSAIRASNSPQVQNKLLLVVAALASFSPELVLHSVMPIFTFMGAHTIRQDDEFSFHVVEQTILCVVPALAVATESAMVEEVEFLLTSFVSAFQHIPRHRRARLFTTLAKTLGSSASIHLILFLCGQQYASAYAKHKMGDCSALTDFSCSFLQNFKVEEQLGSALKFLELWKKVPEEPVEKGSPEFDELNARVVFGPQIVALGKSELFNLRKCLVSFLRHTISDSKDINGISRLRLKIASMILQGEDSKPLLEAFAQLVKDLLEIIDAHQQEVEEEEIVSKLYKLLGEVLSLLPIEHFVQSVLGILQSPDSSLRTRIHITSLTAYKFDTEHVEDLNAHEGIARLVPPLLDIIVSQEDIELSQTALDTLSNLFQRYTTHIDSSLYISTLNVVTLPAGLLNSAPEIVVSSMNCITSVISVIGVKIIGHFTKIVPPLFDIFDKSTESEDQLIQTSMLVLFSTLVKKMPSFVAPNLSDMLKVLFKASHVSDSVRTSVLNVMVSHMDGKTLLTTGSSLWKFVSGLDTVAIGLYLSFMELIIEKIDKKTAISNAGGFVKFLLLALEFRAQKELDSNTINRVEASVHKCGIQYVLKLNDKTFRPLFASIVRWAFDGEDTTTDISETERLISFFRFFNKLQENLRSIITSYYSYLVDSTESLLLRLKTSENTNLKRLVLISLASSFKYDQDEYWHSSTRFTPISSALCSQFDTIEDSIGKYLVKAVTALVQATNSSDEHNKTVNNLLLSHMKATCKPKEKLWAVKTLKTIYNKVGESWLGLLPQLVPIVAELLEDDDEEVEMEVRTGLVKVLEQTMGEPLDRYLD
ncbi:hypothetical protein OGAPHI_004166 [Ogataea philodendri]|uniref:U3 small nucleolar RNA-associated protein 10 n=1 Tax=Ogataea philodendri TaxID=1378263 RepID=A0A9P8P646_9ASCO|nr:uncharacterized protein OGAPHI_004166 [Ogataea philodendri]KAH3665977.1 hypothetical protein OGAPHI_004166 [Ogataea philodendri]